MKIAVWFSCGAASAVALKLTVEKYGVDNVRAVNNPVKEEHYDNLRFLKDVSNWVGIDIEQVKNKNFPKASVVEVFNKRKGMSFPMGAPCTVELKKRARQQWEAENPVDYHVLGFTFDEKRRHERFILTERSNVLPILIDAKMTKDDCFRFLSYAGIKLPKIYEHGFPNANCIGCVKATSPTYWNLVRKEFPEVYEQRSQQSRKLGSKLVRVKNERIFLDELDPNAKGRPMKTMPDCGIFCEEE
jgi:3'-phosphoadenosine 5'-phosphosulfate sulfotransferase (PAPS reductase)/FAD synthetase